MSTLSTILTAMGAAAVFASFLQYLSVLYVDGKLDARDGFAARAAMLLLPVTVLIGVLVLVVVITALVPANFDFLPFGLGACAVIGMIWALERGCRAVLRRRAE